MHRVVEFVARLYIWENTRKLCLAKIKKVNCVNANLTMTKSSALRKFTGNRIEGILNKNSQQH